MVEKWAKESVDLFPRRSGEVHKKLIGVKSERPHKGRKKSKSTDAG